jgi:transcriptional regulator with XRE-family HTH domain
VEEAGLPSIFGEVVRELRHARGLSQERLAAEAGVDRGYMGLLERGGRNPSLTMMARVANGLGVALSDVVKAMEERRGARAGRTRNR